MKKTYVFGFLIFLFLIASYTLIYAVKPEQVLILNKEDGVVETCSVVCYFLSACFLFYLFFRSKSIKEKYPFRNRRNYFFLLIGLFFFFCVGEEISWGQRIFNIETPDWLKLINRQNEINFHNLNIAQGTDEFGNAKTGISMWITAGRIFILFIFLYCVLVPILYNFSAKTHGVLKKMCLPIVPMWIAPFFIINFAAENLIERISFFDSPPRFGETIENNYAILFLLVSISFYFNNKKDNS